MTIGPRKTILALAPAIALALGTTAHPALAQDGAGAGMAGAVPPSDGFVRSFSKVRHPGKQPNDTEGPCLKQ